MRNNAKLTHAEKVQFIREALARTPTKDMATRFAIDRGSIRTYSDYARRNKWPKGYTGWQKAQAEAMMARARELLAAPVGITLGRPRSFTESAPPPRVVVGETTDNILTGTIGKMFGDAVAREQDARIEGTTSWSWTGGIATNATREPSVGIIRRMWRFLW